MPTTKPRKPRRWPQVVKCGDPDGKLKAVWTHRSVCTGSFKGPKWPALQFVYPKQLAEFLSVNFPQWAESPFEHFLVVPVRGNGQPAAVFEAGVGGVSAVMLTMPQIFAPVIGSGCVKFHIMHNHPAGISSPSAEDVSLTQRLREAAPLYGLMLEWHVVVGVGSSGLRFDVL
jgi:DNA repair protein RadC